MGYYPDIDLRWFWCETQMFSSAQAQAGTRVLTAWEEVRFYVVDHV